MDDWLVNGVTQSTVSVDDRGLAYGDGVFETIAVRDCACRFLDAHLARLAAGCRQLGIPHPDNVPLLADIEQLLDATGTHQGVMKIIITRGSGPRGYAYQRDQLQPTRIVGIAAGQQPAVSPDGVRVRLCATPVSSNSHLAGIKSLNRLAQVLGRAEWDDPDIAEGLMADDQGNLIGGTMSNLFMVRQGKLWTPPVTECGVAGIMRGQVMQAAEQQIDILEQYFSATDLGAADEVFLTNSLIGIWPVAALDKQRFNVGPETRQLMQSLAERGVSECRQ